MQTQIFRKTFLGLMALGLTLSMFAILSCSSGDDDDGNNFIQRQANLTGAAEQPIPVTTNATGSSLLTVSDDQQSIFFTLTYIGLTNVQQAHIHVGDASIAGGIILFLCTNIGTGANVAIGGGPLPTPQACPQGASVTITGTLTEANLSPKPAQGVNTFADAIANLISGNTYTNVHTAANPGGEIRGQDNP
jgi:hypothetical protein